MTLQIRLSLKSEASQKQYWMHKEDLIILGRIRPCASDPDVISPGTKGCPAVWVLDEPNLKVQLNKYWQFYLVAINYNMIPKKVSDVLEYGKALTNGTGFGDPDDPRRNYITEEDVGEPLPAFDKDRTMSRSMLSGIEDGNDLIVRTLNGNLPPPLKAGKRQPETLSEINPDDYLYMPETDWDLFFACNIINLQGKVIQFPNGGLYPWFFGGTHPVVWMPHVSRESTIRYPKSNLLKLPLGTDRIFPYTT